jgi:hypothetical protein
MIYGIDYAPVVRYGIPNRRDGEGAYELFWDEETNRIENGYKPPLGTWIPGNYYFYLNYGTIRGFPEGPNGKRAAKPIPMKPIYRDGDHHVFQHLHQCKVDGWGAILPKGRRRGYSWMIDHVVLHEFITSESAQMAVGSQGEPNKGYVKEFRNKFDLSLSRLPDELRPSLGLEDNMELLRTGWSDTVNGEKREYGLMNIIHWVNFANPDKLRGLQLSLCVWEEAGEIDHLLSSFLATLECFKEGDWMFGLPIIGGTSNKIRHDSMDFQEMCENAEDKYHLRPLFLDATTCYFPMYDTKTGISDREGAKALHEANLKRLKKTDGNGNNTAYWTYRQEYPQEWSDLWLTYGSTTFDLEIINNQIAYLSTSESSMQGVEYGELEWPKDKDGNEIEGGMPIWVPKLDGKLLKCADNLPHLQNAHSAGYDPYFIDDSVNGGNRNADPDNSKAACVVRRRYIDGNTLGDMPSMLYFDRPYLKEESYMYTWKMCVYYNTQVLAETGDDMFFKFFIDRKIARFLKPRPIAAESPNSEAQNRYGVNMKGYQKALAEGLADNDLKRNISNHRMIPLLKQLAVYGTKNTDIAMAYMIALIHDYDMSRIMVTDQADEVEKLKLPSFSEVNGRIVSNFGATSRERLSSTGNSFSERFNYGY